MKTIKPKNLSLMNLLKTDRDNISRMFLRKIITMDLIMKDNFLMAKKMEKESIFIKTVINILEIGLMTNSMEKEFIFSQEVTDMKAI